jgi:ribosomal protein S18 acetylase RimI-like enzyme
VEDARVATPADIARVADLARALRTQLLDERGGALWSAREARPEPLEPALAALLERDDAMVLVGTLDEHVVGYGVVQVEQLRDGTRLGVIDEIYVEPEARAVGVGELLVERLVDFCVRAECIGVDAAALPGDRQAKNFFERAGFTARILTMHKNSAPRSGRLSR